MARIRKFIALLTLILLIPSSTRAVSADCSAYEVYLVKGVYPINGWLLIVVEHDSYVCGMIAGEWESRLDFANSLQEYYVLTDGERAFLLGGYGPSLMNTTPVGMINGTFYVLKVEKSKEPYKNVTLTIDGEPKNFTLIKNVTVRETYRFEGNCLEKVSECTITAYPNGTVTKRCNGAQLNVSAFKLPSTQTYGSYVEAREGRIAFNFEGKDYTATLPGDINASMLRLTAFKAKRGIVLINREVVQLPAGEGLDEAPLLSRIENGTVSLLEVPPDFSELVCEKPVVSATNATAELHKPATHGRKICGTAFLVLLATSALAVRRRK
ncbi:hypothetical protein E3E36_09460 [Thermococcus sp. M36]|uniref:hypothetical protein n=1 Tax=Thermococcus sp. M36 TaxID=1638261 RepID=UPI001439DCC7|nr:hypothetical protein [Thermococcus sp. M36]NJE06367.1 hypothetical protein [Thermococcus sp. M36]